MASIISFLDGIVKLANALIGLFKKTEAEKEKEARDAVAKESDSVKNGGLPE